MLLQSMAYAYRTGSSVAALCPARQSSCLAAPGACQEEDWAGYLPRSHADRYDPGMSVVGVALALVLFYWIIRKAVRDGMRDAWKRRSRETGRTTDDTCG
jgi:hypothetical protein